MSDPPSNLPAGLAGVLNHPDESRDSAYYSNLDASSKHTSTQSTYSHAVLTPPPMSGYPGSSDHTPSPIASHSAQPLPSPAGSMSVASMVSPSADQSMLRKLDRQSAASYESAGTGSAFSGPDSRRESINSQLGLGELRLGGSTYSNNNHSSTSIQSTLQQRRNPGNVSSPQGRYSNGYVPPVPPVPPGANLMSPKQTRNAPVITGPAMLTIAGAREPIAGQPWAFPQTERDRGIPKSDPFERPEPSREPEETINRQGQSFLDSRRSSFAESVASSQFTTESRYPPGQRRLEEGFPPEFQRNSRASSELQGPTHHHHSLQSKSVGDLQSDAGSPSSSQPYSRTPELRVSHKLAERKRRTEMKELFDNLRDLMPQERGSKASKWEILTKAIAEYGRLHEAIKSATNQATMAKRDADACRHENNSLRNENNQLRTEISRLTGGHQSHEQHAIEPTHPSGGYGNGHSSAVSDYEKFQRSRQGPSFGGRPDQDPNAPFGRAPEQQLPPLRLNGSGQEPMNGVQFHGHDPRSGYEQHRF